MDDDDSAQSTSRRRVFKLLALVPLSAIGLSSPSGTPYRPTFFNATEWAFLHAACDRLIPADDVGPGALQVGVPEFIDRHMQTPYASGDIWYMQGPFIEAAPQFGYQGRLTVRDILRVGIHAMDMHCQANYSGKAFTQLAAAEQESLLTSAESGQLQLEEISSREFFNQLLAETRLGYFCDPAYGGNKDMLAWEMVGYPGARADYADWVEVRDRPYPLPPVDLAGKRG
jgi:gluconate 2-dehydrogenase gamma chain